jgi:hypothetical protein
MDHSILELQAGGSGVTIPSLLPDLQFRGHESDGGDGGDGGLPIFSARDAAERDQLVPDERRSIADALVEMARRAGVELFHDPDRRGYARISRDGRVETQSIRSEAFALTLRWLYYIETGKSPNSQAWPMRGPRSRRRRSSLARLARSVVASPARLVASTSICATSSGGWWRFRPTAGG